MFTGIVERVGTVLVRSAAGRGATLRIELGPLAAEVASGDSIAVDGACLTAARLGPDHAEFDVSPETVRRTTIAAWRVGRRVNLERALVFGGRLGGHLVAGHVDGVGRLLERVRRDASEVFTFLLPERGAVRVVEKASVAVDGVSLTTYACRGRRFSVSLVPHTLTATTLEAMRPGHRVNLEQDPIGRWVEAGSRGVS